MGVRIITDSTSDISPDLKESLQIAILPLTVTIDEKEYIDGITLTPKQFYEKLRQSQKLPFTSQITVGAFTDAFKAAAGNGDDVVCITLSSELSGTYQSACIARDSMECANIYVIDSRTVTMGLAAVVYEAIRMRDKGFTAKEIYDNIEQLKTKLHLYAVIDDLTYLQKGGRLSGAGAIVGRLLGIKPLIKVENGLVLVAHKARGMDNAYQWMLDTVKAVGIDRSRLVHYGDSDCEEQLKVFVDRAAEYLEIRDYVIESIGPTVGTHAGPGCLGIAFFAN